jgi:hypothetical protein
LNPDTLSRSAVAPTRPGAAGSRGSASGASAAADAAATQMESLSEQMESLDFGADTRRRRVGATNVEEDELTGLESVLKGAFRDAKNEAQAKVGLRPPSTTHRLTLAPPRGLLVPAHTRTHTAREYSLQIPPLRHLGFVPVRKHIPRESFHMSRNLKFVCKRVTNHMR